MSQAQLKKATITVLAGADAHKTKYRTAVARGCGDRRVSTPGRIFRLSGILQEDFFHPIYQGLEFKVGKFTRIKKNMMAGYAFLVPDMWLLRI